MRKEILQHIEKQRDRLSAQGEMAAHALEAEEKDHILYTNLYHRSGFMKLNDVKQILLDELDIVLSRCHWITDHVAFMPKLQHTILAASNGLLPCRLTLGQWPSCGHGRNCYHARHCPAAKKHAERLGSFDELRGTRYCTTSLYTVGRTY